MKIFSAIFLAFLFNFIFYLIFLITKAEISISLFFRGFFANPLESIIYLIPSLFTSVFLIIMAVTIKNKRNVYLVILLILFLMFSDLFLTKKLYGSVNIDNYLLSYKGFLDIIYIVMVLVMYKSSCNCCRKILN
jgi:hypothetical protein